MFRLVNIMFAVIVAVNAAMFIRNVMLQTVNIFDFSR